MLPLKRCSETQGSLVKLQMRPCAKTSVEDRIASGDPLAHNIDLPNRGKTEQARRHARHVQLALEWCASKLAQLAGCYLGGLCAPVAKLVLNRGDQTDMKPVN